MTLNFGLLEKSFKEGLLRLNNLLFLVQPTQCQIFDFLVLVKQQLSFVPYLI